MKEGVTDEAKDLLVDNFFVVVHILASNGWVLFGMGHRQGGDLGDEDSHEVRVVRQDRH